MSPPGTPSGVVTDPYGNVTVSTPAPTPGAPTEGANNVLTLFVPTAGTVLSLGGVGPDTKGFEKKASPGFNLGTGEDFSFEVGGEWKGHVGKNVDIHITGKKEEVIDDNWFEHKLAHQLEIIGGATAEVFVGIKQESMLALKHELIVGGLFSNIYAYKSETITGWVKETINGPETKTVNGPVTETINGVEFKTVTLGVTEEIGGNGEDKTVVGGVRETITGGEKKTINGGKEETVNGDEKVTVNGNVNHHITGNEDHHVDGNSHLKCIDQELKITNWKLEATKADVKGNEANIQATKSELKCDVYSLEGSIAKIKSDLASFGEGSSLVKLGG